MKITKKLLIFSAIFALIIVFGCTKKEEAAPAEKEELAAQELTPKEMLGKRLFFDANLSRPILCNMPWTDCRMDRAG
jgi:cytochrome c peroxidase